MGNNQIRESHFQRTDTPEATRKDEFDNSEKYISISNKMVERLVEDATLAGKAAAKETSAPRGDYKEKIFMEKLVITVDDLRETAARIELRTANMVSVAPVCADCKQRVIDCYERYPNEQRLQCSEVVAAFSRCVKGTAARRLRARTQKDAREHARRERRVAHARVHELRDLAPPQEATG
ncbi:unnamed protein product, partial [Iphiclides podalirius]